MHRGDHSGLDDRVLLRAIIQDDAAQPTDAGARVSRIM
jgi:hypothetical protein